MRLNKLKINMNRLIYINLIMRFKILYQIRLKKIINNTLYKIFHNNKLFKTSFKILPKKILDLLLNLMIIENLYLKREKNITWEKETSRYFLIIKIIVKKRKMIKTHQLTFKILRIQRKKNKRINYLNYLPLIRKIKKHKESLLSTYKNKK